MILLPAAPLVGASFDLGAILPAAAAIGCTAVAMTSLGLVFAWRCTSSAGFHGVMNLVLLPMWLLSSAMFPADGAAPWLRTIMRIDPLTWCTEAIRAPLLGRPFEVPLAMSAGFAVVMVIAATVVVGRRG